MNSELLNNSFKFLFFKTFKSKINEEPAKNIKILIIKIVNVENSLTDELNVLNPPVDKVVKVLITANDVLHAWALPSFGVKRDAVPGRINETWFKAEREGTFYGQCSELCGIKHAFMPIEVRVVSEEDYQLWLEEAKIKFAKEDIFKNNKLIASNK